MNEVVAIIFKSADGRVSEIDIDEGMSLMSGAVQAGVEGIEAECGGAASCATCHVYIEGGWQGRIPDPSAIEAALLDCVLDQSDESRLSCQIVVSPALEGLAVRIPKAQK